MTYEFVIGPVTWQYSTEALGFTARSGHRVQHIAWDEVLSAGLSAKRPIVLPREFPTSILPGFGTLAKRAEELSLTTQLLWILRRRGPGRKLALFNIPIQGDEQKLLVSELRSRLGERWIDENMNVLQVRRKFGISNWWIYPGTALLMLLALFAIILWQYVQELRPIGAALFGVSALLFLYRWLRSRRY